MRSSPNVLSPRAVADRPRYVGRFAPSPTGPLHRGSLVAALASWLDARAHAGQWLVRVEDLDPPREVAGAAEDQLATLAGCGLVADGPVLRQSARQAHYAAALARLAAAGQVYACRCSRRDIDAAGGPPGIYPGTCRARGLPLDTPDAALRLRVTHTPVTVVDRALGVLTQDLASAVGDFVIRRADGLYAYQLAVVVDDADQAVTDVVRGADLWDNTPRQRWLQQLLNLPQPRTLHVSVVSNAAGEKLSKQTGARELDPDDPLGELSAAWAHLGFEPLAAPSVQSFLAAAIARWRERWAGVAGFAEPSR